MNTCIFIEEGKGAKLNVDMMMSGGDVIDTDGLYYASESTAAILMLVFQYVTDGGMKIALCCLC